VTIRKPLTWLVVATLLPVVVCSAILVSREVQHQRADIEDSMKQQAHTLLLVVEHKLESSITTLQALATSPLLDVPDLETYHRIVAAARLEAHPEWNAVGLLEPSGQALLSTLAPFGASLPSYADHPALQKILTDRRPIVTDLGTGRLVGRPSFGIFVPVLRNGQLRYVLAAAMSAEAVSGFVDPAVLPPMASVRVLDSQLVTVARVPSTADAIGVSASPAFVAQTRAAPDGWWRFVSPEGEAFYTAYVRSRRLGWTMAMAVPAAVVEGPTRQALWLLGGGTLAFLLLGVGLAFVFSRFITRPIATLATGAGRVARGETPALGSTGLAEIDAVARALEAAIAERARGELALRETEARLRTTLQSIGDAVIATDTRGRITLMNGVAEVLTGWTQAEAIGTAIGTVLILVNEGTRQPAENPVGRVLREGTITGLANHTVLVSKAGREIPIDDSAAPIRDGDGGLVGVVMVFRDITERRHAEGERAALLEQERSARAEAERVARMLGQLQVVTEPMLSDVSADLLMRELLTRVRTALASDTATILLLTEDGARLSPVSSDGLREAVAEDVEVPLGHSVAGRLAASDGGLIFPDLTKEEVQNPFVRDRVKSLVGAPLRVGGRLIGVVHVGSSAPRHYTEDDLRLLRLVADRMALAIDRVRLHEAERVAQREAEAANQAKDAFLATVSHELRQPLNAILGWSRIVRAGTHDEAALMQALEVIERNAKLQEGLIADLLDVSRIVTGRLRLDIQPVDLRAVIGTGLDVVRPAASARGIHLETALDPSASLVSGDADRLQQVLWNLLSNAVKFTPKGGRIEVRLQRVDSQAELAVSDTGEGISAELLPHLFERFRQADRPGGRAREGLGLGLSIVRHLVELHGGTVRADSAGPGRGATFTVRLPLMAVQVPVGGLRPMGSDLERGWASGAPPPVLRGSRVLVVDDEADAREMLRTVLETSGAIVTLAGSAEEALEMLERVRADVLVSDIAMPGEDGHTLIRKVRAWPPERGGTIPAVAVTAHARAEDRTRALVAGFQLHVPKPVDAAELVAVVTSLLDRGANQDEPRAQSKG
jgi:PAS domain S-box-containing protein